MITIQELLFNRGLDKNAVVKLVRHKETGKDIFQLYKTNKSKFLKYQNLQKTDIFKNVNYIVTFIGQDGKLARFVGVYKIDDAQQGDFENNCKFKYQMSEVAGFEDLKERVIINWENPISWHQYIKNEMEIVEIQAGLHYRQFTDYMDFIISFDELTEIVNNEYADWKRMLCAVKGIYLIHDSYDGKLYIGSAYSDLGIWGRWKSYVTTQGHGTNKLLSELIKSDKSRAKYFQFSILMILPKTIASEEAIKKEQLFKNKLGSKAFGLNAN